MNKPPTGEKQEMHTAGVETEVTLTGDSNQLVEIDLTEEAKQFWSQVKESSEISVSLRAGAEECQDHSQPPARFFNPAELPQETVSYRDIPFQPILVIFANDDELKARKSKMRDRKRRSLESDSCTRHDYPIIFHNLGLTDVWFPYFLNIGKCSGSCSESTLRYQTTLSTNHARVMSTIRLIQDVAPSHGESITTSGLASAPCCVPASFSPNTALVILEDSNLITFRTDYYKDLVVETCSCQ